MNDLKATCENKMAYRRGWLAALWWAVAVVGVNDQDEAIEMLRQKFDEMKSEALKYETPESSVAHELMED